MSNFVKILKIILVYIGTPSYLNNQALLASAEPPLQDLSGAVRLRLFSSDQHWLVHVDAHQGGQRQSGVRNAAE